MQTVRFDKKSFDHAKTGFQLLGKHASTDCERCHTKKNIKLPEALTVLAKGRKTYLGLEEGCVSCHEDRHGNTVGVDCQSCHTASTWKPASKFDHAKARYKLVGKHTTVECNKCHTSIAIAAKDIPLKFSVPSFSDCAPCHRSPHTDKFASQSCSSCHTPEKWSTARASGFDHNKTTFRLIGQHASVKCEACHKPTSANPYRLKHDACADCHADYHKGEFRTKYGSDCAKCHTESGFRPSTFSLAAHAKARFALTGAHEALPCMKCHSQSSSDRMSFRFVDLRCESCHRDIHAGQFVSRMSDKSCEICHSTEQWKIPNFDHAKTKFPLVGKHSTTECVKCHKTDRIKGVQTSVYVGTTSACESCHKDAHGGQFAASGATNCEKCHSAHGWESLVFDHNTQSTFSLTGGHQKVPCGSCHQEEWKEGIRLVQYKGTPQKCESCHQKGVSNG